MKSYYYAFLLPLMALGTRGLASPIASRPVPSRPVSPRPILMRAGTIALPGVEGRFDHFAFDKKTGRIFVAALENRSVEVVDVKARKRVKSIGGLNEPQGVFFLPRYNRLMVCSRGDGTLRTFNARTFQEGAWADLGRNADNVRYDATTGTIYVGSKGEPGEGGLDAVDLRALLPVEQGGKPFPPRSPADLLLTRPRRADPKASVALSSHPESFQIDSLHQRLFVNIPDEHVVVTIDLRTFKIISQWPVPFKRNFPMAFSAARDRVYVGCRNSPHLLVYRASTGQLLSQQPCVGDADDLYYDGPTGRLYLIGGGGEINVFDARLDKPRLLQTIKTAPRARTGLFIPSLRMLAIAVPHTPGHRAEIQLFKIKP